jgi:hypothetical protein
MKSSKPVSAIEVLKLKKELQKAQDRIGNLELLVQSLTKPDPALERLKQDHAVFGPLPDPWTCPSQLVMTPEIKASFEDVAKKYHAKHHPEDKMVLGTLEDMYI